MYKKLSVILLSLTALLYAVSCGPDEKTKKLMEQAKELFPEVPKSMPGAQKDTKERIALGETLYHDVRLSVNDTQSCNTCHNVKGGGFGVDNQRFSPGALPGTKGGRNAPTSLNAGFHIAQFWDGRAKDLAEQAKGPILNPVEMGMPSAEAVIEKLSKIPEYKTAFAKAFPDQKEALTYDNLAEAIAAFERTLITHDRFDDFRAGNASALTKEEKEGLQLFIETGCISCHNGPILGGNSYRKMGQVNPYANTKDKGRYEITKNKNDMYVFKVPSLKNVAKTAPYFHDGSAATLEEAVEQMAWLQLGKKLSDTDIKKIVAFLGSLTGSVQK